MVYSFGDYYKICKFFVEAEKQEQINAAEGAAAAVVHAAKARALASGNERNIFTKESCEIKYIHIFRS